MHVCCTEDRVLHCCLEWTHYGNPLRAILASQVDVRMLRKDKANRRRHISYDNDTTPLSSPDGITGCTAAGQIVEGPRYSTMTRLGIWTMGVFHCSSLKPHNCVYALDSCMAQAVDSLYRTWICSGYIGLPTV